jgi:LysM repeat protein
MADRSSVGEGRNPARLAAPLALLAAAVAVAAVIAASAGTGSPSNAPAAARTVATQAARHRRSPPRAYVVKAGDTLSVIAARTGVSLDAIQQLNPGVDPQALQAGQRLKLTR